MGTATIYTVFEISDLRFGVNHAKCWNEKPDFSHWDNMGYEIIIKIPKGGKVITNERYDTVLVIPSQQVYTPLYYNHMSNRVEGLYGTIEGVEIVQKTEI